MTRRRTLRSAAAIAVVAVSVLLMGATATPAPDPSTGPVPDDPSDPVRASEYWLDGARVREAWQATRGEGVRIAIIDTGIGDVPQTFGDAVVGGTDVSGPGRPTAAPRWARSTAITGRGWPRSPRGAAPPTAPA